MKEYILKVAKDLENGIITEDKAKKNLLRLFGVDGVLKPLTIDNVGKMLDNVSEETWVAARGDGRGWREWWSNRNKFNLNKGHNNEIQS